MKTEAEMWHDYAVAFVGADEGPGSAAKYADLALDEYRKRWPAPGDQPTTSTQPADDQPEHWPPDMLEAVALCWALAGGGMDAPQVEGLCARLRGHKVQRDGRGNWWAVYRNYDFIRHTPFGQVERDLATDPTGNTLRLYRAAITLLGGSNA